MAFIQRVYSRLLPPAKLKPMAMLISSKSGYSQCMLVERAYGGNSIWGMLVLIPYIPVSTAGEVESLEQFRMFL